MSQPTDTTFLAWFRAVRIALAAHRATRPAVQLAPVAFYQQAFAAGCAPDEAALDAIDNAR